MANVFHPSMNTISRVTIFGAVGFIALMIWVLWFVVRTPYITEARVIREQPVPFSHQHHVGDVGIDCRYCHNSVEKAGFAGIPSTAVCMNCHSHLFNDQPMLQPVRESFVNGTPLAWTRVHDVPDFSHFNHSIHIHKGVGCVTCHGEVDKMPLMWRENSLLMEWCIQCHKDPQQSLRPREFIFHMESLEALTKQREFREFLAEDFPELDPENPDLDRLRASLAEMYRVRDVTDCSACHY